MTDTELLQDYIDRSGLKIKFIAEKVGLTPYGFSRKRDGLSEFTPSEIAVLCDVLHIETLEERWAVFFCKGG